MIFSDFAHEFGDLRASRISDIFLRKHFRVLSAKTRLSSHSKVLKNLDGQKNLKIFVISLNTNQTGREICVRKLKKVDLVLQIVSTTLSGNF